MERAEYIPLRVERVEHYGGLAWIRASMLEEPRGRYCPGVFAMLWVPGLEAVPMSIAWMDGYGVEFIVRKVGETTARLYSARRGEHLGMVAPLGSCVDVGEARRALLIGGGSGVAPLLWLASSLERSLCRVTLVLGFRDAREAMIRRVFEHHGLEPIVVCEEGGEGCDRVGLAVGRWLRDLGEYDVVVASGPLPMLREAYRLFGERLIVGLEAMVRCGLGFCGSCRLWPGGPLLCRDGPFLRAEDARVVLSGGV